MSTPKFSQADEVVRGEVAEVRATALELRTDLEAALRRIESLEGELAELREIVAPKPEPVNCGQCRLQKQAKQEPRGCTTIGQVRKHYLDADAAKAQAAAAAPAAEKVPLPEEPPVVSFSG